MALPLGRSACAAEPRFARLSARLDRWVGIGRNSVGSRTCDDVGRPLLQSDHRVGQLHRCSQQGTRCGRQEGKQRSRRHPTLKAIEVDYWDDYAQAGDTLLTRLKALGQPAVPGGARWDMELVAAFGILVQVGHHGSSRAHALPLTLSQYQAKTRELDNHFLIDSLDALQAMSRAGSHTPAALKTFLNCT